jgi:hypothetical protein
MRTSDRSTIFLNAIGEFRAAAAEGLLNSRGCLRVRRVRCHLPPTHGAGCLPNAASSRHSVELLVFNTNAQQQQRKPPDGIAMLPRRSTIVVKI